MRKRHSYSQSRFAFLRAGSSFSVPCGLCQRNLSSFYITIARNFRFLVAILANLTVTVTVSKLLGALACQYVHHLDSSVSTIALDYVQLIGNLNVTPAQIVCHKVQYRTR